ncbi:Hint domain-containing protein [Amycolatopsis sp. WGS_07]|uniref:Hint domain-containing protein n=1 Tax=Amycolatopsis sp. WGS_07 TaxID=3076764 RepID=UPI003872C5AC
MYEFSGAKDLVDGCFRDPAVVGCIKGVLEVGVWFVPGGAAARGTELAVSGGAHLIEGEVGVEGRAVAEDLAAGCTRNSFAGSTPVLMADGTMKPIEQVKVGDKVRNAEPDNANTEIHTVTAVHITDTDRDFVDVTVATPGGPKKITSTAHHRWWDATTHTWTDATDLRPGDLLDTPGGGHVAVQTLNRYTSSFRTYNLTIDTTHTYYVLAGATPILVHNNSCPIDSVPGPEKGESFPLPKGAAGVPVDTGKGMVYDIPAGTEGLDSRVTQVRVMDPVTTGKYQYPNGYVVYMNKAGQSVNPADGKTIAKSSPYNHLALP